MNSSYSQVLLAEEVVLLLLFLSLISCICMHFSEIWSSLIKQFTSLPVNLQSLLVALISMWLTIELNPIL